MALIINHNMPAMKAARFLDSAYGKLSKSIERLSSGLRINSAADDAAGLAIREMMRADIATTLQGIRNASDAISLIQTADGALEVIDEKLIRMKELAEQAATGTYTDSQREFINSEYQAMAAEIDRIANAANFNGVKLLDGSLNRQNGGLGIRIHFGVGNSAAEDYYYVKTDDVRATSNTGLRIGGDGTNDIWSAGPYGDGAGGCCGGAIQDLDDQAITAYGNGFAYGYNWDGSGGDGSSLLTSRYLAGRYGFSTSTTYQDLIDNVNNGTQSRVIVRINATALSASGTTANYLALCLDNNEVYYVGSSDVVESAVAGKSIYKRVVTAAGATLAAKFASAINTTSTSQFWAMVSGAGATARLIVFSKQGGNNNNLVAEEKASTASDATRMFFINAATGASSQTVGQFSLGGEHWGTLVAPEQRGGGYSIALLGRDVGDGMDLHIAGAAVETTFSAKLASAGITTPFMNALRGTSFTEIQDAADGQWVGAEVRTQEAAQQALLAINDAILRKDTIRANVGAIQNRLEGTIASLTIQVENLQASESRISDVDVATEMTEFTKNNILAQAATSMLAQANSLGALALTLIGGY